MERVSAQTGSVHAYQWADLFANVSGYLKKQEIEVNGASVPVDIGLHVKKGDLVAEINVPEVVAAAEEAAAEHVRVQAQEKQAEAALGTAQTMLDVAKKTVFYAQAQVGRYVAKRKETLKAYTRYSGLRKLGAVEQDVVDQREDEYESAVAAEEAAKAEVERANAEVSAAQAKVKQAEADLNEAKTAVDVAKAKLDRANVFVEYTRIRSPYTGVITARNFHVGDFIRSATSGIDRPLLTVARTDVLRVVTKVADKDVPYLDVGDPAVITLTALPGLKIQGKVSRFSHTEDPTERTMRTEIDVENTEQSQTRGKVVEGMYGLATIIVQPASGHLTLPSSCVIVETAGNEGHGEGARAEKRYVFVARDGVARRTAVTTGADDGLRIEILSDLTTSDQVIVPNSAVADGTAVTPTTAQP
jgi:RND family efflux transporter MFP subunit